MRSSRRVGRAGCGPIVEVPRRFLPALNAGFFSSARAETPPPPGHEFGLWRREVSWERGLSHESQRSPVVSPRRMSAECMPISHGITPPADIPAPFAPAAWTSARSPSQPTWLPCAVAARSGREPCGRLRRGSRRAAPARRAAASASRSRCMRNQRTTRRRTCSASVARSAWVIGRAGDCLIPAASPSRRRQEGRRPVTSGHEDPVASAETRPARRA
jgi:hypothetical protein